MRGPAGSFSTGPSAVPSLRRADPAEDGVAPAGEHAKGHILRRDEDLRPHQAARRSSAGIRHVGVFWGPDTSYVCVVSPPFNLPFLEAQECCFFVSVILTFFGAHAQVFVRQIIAVLAWRSFLPPSAPLRRSRFGKRFITAHKISPDGFVQMAIVYGYYGLYGDVVAAYEPVLTKVKRLPFFFLCFQNNVMLTKVCPYVRFFLFRVTPPLRCSRMLIRWYSLYCLRVGLDKGLPFFFSRVSAVQISYEPVLMDKVLSAYVVFRNDVVLNRTFLFVSLT